MAHCKMSIPKGLICPVTRCHLTMAARWFRLVPRKGKPVKSIHLYQDEEALNIDLEFEDKSMLEMIFRVGFRSTINLLENKDGNYHLRKKIKPKHRGE
jgi:hypothetical protein